MNILLVNMSVDPVLGGGTVERICQLARELKKLPDTQTKVLSTTAGLSPEEDVDSSLYTLLPCLSERWYIPVPNLWVIYKSIRWADVILLSSHWTLINALAYIVNKLVGRPYLFCPAGALHIYGRSGLIKRAYNAVVGTAILKCAARVVAIPKDEAELFYKLGVAKERVVVIANGISPDDFTDADVNSFRAKHQLGDAPFLLFMGRLNKIKGPDILLQSFLSVASEYPDWHLVFAGPNGGMAEDLSLVISEYGFEGRVHMIGFVSGEEKSQAYHAAEMLVVPSRLEAMSIVALEAAICGTPVLMTDQCGFSELVDASGGLEVPVDAKLISEAMRELMSDLPHLKCMGEKARLFIKDNYTWEVAAMKHRSLCDEIINVN